MAFQVSTTQLEEELIMETSEFIGKENQHLLAKVNLYTPNQIKSCVRKLYFSISLCYTRKPGYESLSF